MKDKLIYIILLSLCIVTGCEFPNDNNMEHEEFYPMEIGNQWEYMTVNTSRMEEIFDTLRVRGELFYGFTDGSKESEYWMRETNNKIYYLNITDSTEFLLYDFTASIGDSWELPSGYDCSFGRGVTLISKTDTIYTPNETYYDCYHFIYKTVCRDAGMVDAWFVKGVGKVKYRFETFFGIQEYVIKKCNFQVPEPR